VRCRFIQAEKANHSIMRLCGVMAVARATFYGWRNGVVGKRKAEDADIKPRIRQIFLKSKKTYGTRRIVRELRKENIRLGRRRVARLMRELGLRPKQARKFKATTDSAHRYPVAPNLLERDFAPDAPDRVWCGDITYVWTREGWLYLAVLIDLYSRRVVGWAMSSRITKELTLCALKMAVWQRRPAPGWIQHTDRGSQYAAHAYRDALIEAGARCSMSRKGDCWDNAPSESFFASLKKEALFEESFATREQAHAAIIEYVRWYNAERLHSSLGYETPNSFENRAELTSCQAA